MTAGALPLADAPLQLHSRIYGRPGSPPLIILHGLFGSSNNWHTLAQRFGGQYRVCALDLRNHGDSPWSDVFTCEAMAEDVAGFMQAEGIGSASLLGHSLGAKVAMECALSHPELTEKLIAVDMAPRAYPREHDHILATLSQFDPAGWRSRDEADRALASGIPDMRERQFILTNLKRDAEGKYFWRMNLRVIRDRYDEVIAPVRPGRSFEKPALFIAGGRSHYLLPSDEKEIRETFPQATLVRLDGAGHWVHADAPDAFYRTVTRFLS